MGSAQVTPAAVLQIQNRISLFKKGRYGGKKRESGLVVFFKCRIRMDADPSYWVIVERSVDMDLMMTDSAGLFIGIRCHNEGIWVYII